MHDSVVELSTRHFSKKFQLNQKSKD